MHLLFFVDLNSTEKFEYDNCKAKPRQMLYNSRLCVVQNPMYNDCAGKKVTLINKPLYSLNFCQVINGETITVSTEKDLLCFVALEAENGRQAIEKSKIRNTILFSWII